MSGDMKVTEIKPLSRRSLAGGLSRLTAIVAALLMVIFPAWPVSASTQVAWEAQSAAEANSWDSVTWSPELNLFVAVSQTGTNQVMTSPDGIAWTPRAASEANQWTSVTWSPELALFVAVAQSGTSRIMASPDGIVWTPRTAPEANGWTSVTWSPELDLFVAVAQSGTNRVMTSPDGIAWTPRAASEANLWTSVTWSPELNLFAAVAINGTNQVMTSSNSVTWTARAAAEANEWTSVTWSPELSLFVAVAGTGGANRVMTSLDGITWTARAAAEANEWRSVTWSPELNLFVAVSQTGTNRVMTSPDGIAWTGYPAPVADGWYSVTWSPELSLFVAVAGTGGANRVMTGIPADNDGIPGTVEDAAPNNGDANNDGIIDTAQGHVASFVNPVTGKYVALEINAICDFSAASATAEASNAVADSGFNYPNGLMNFTASCPVPGFTATVTQYLYGVTNDGFILRKYNPNTNAYFAVSGATLEQTTIGGQTVTKATYQVTDGGSLDTDGSSNGTIVDPAGLAQSAVGAPNTGLGGRF
jgi:hypothetical protein